jgi:ribosomal peptide maturation radical SAM protein 1
MREQSEGAGVDICFAVPPFHPLHFPALGVSMLKRACEERGFSATVIYGGLSLAAAAGFEAYDQICSANKAPMLGDRLFRLHAYAPETTARLHEPDPLPPAAQAMYDAVDPFIGPALDKFVQQVLALRPRIVGIPSSFDQNLAASALARLVKLQAPDVCVVMGGPNVAWPMARGLADVFPWVDHFFAGESDVDFPEFCERFLRHGERPAERIIRSEPIQDLRLVSAPDFTDFFTALRPLQAAGALPDWLPRYLTAESSRGCWWGAKHHCTFCGLNGVLGMDFREKPTERVREEFAELSQWGVNLFWMVDNIMPLKFLTELLPTLATSGPRVQMFYEVKANLTEAQIDIMARGGITSIQPGIESLSSHVLDLMRKGVSAHQNIALLRSAAGVGMWVIWNILYGFPGETVEDFESQITLMPKIAHLQPTSGAHKIVIDRFSPFFNEPEALGVGPITPYRIYRAFYPPGAVLTDIAYHFDANEYSTEFLDHPEVLVRLHAAIKQWKDAWSRDPRPVLQLFEKGTSTFVLDTRPIAREAVTRLSPEQDAALQHLERPRSRAAIDPQFAEAADWLVARDFVIDHEGKLMSVVVRPRTVISEEVAQLASTDKMPRQRVRSQDEVRAAVDAAAL